MLASASGNFADMMTAGMRIEEWVRKGRLVKDSVPTDDSEEEDQDMSVVESQPQQQYLAYHPVSVVRPITNDVQSPGYQPQFQQYQQRPRQQAQKAPQYDPIPMKYATLLHYLLERNLVQTRPPPPIPKKLSARWRPDLFCVFHQGAQGHDVERCFSLKIEVQKLIEADLIPFEEFEFECAS